MPCPTVFTSSSKWNFNLSFLLVLGSGPRFYPQPSKSSHLAIRMTQTLLHPSCWSAPLPWAPTKTGISLQTCSLSSTQMTQVTAAPSSSTSAFPLPSQRHLSTWLSQVFSSVYNFFFFPYRVAHCHSPGNAASISQLFHISKWRIITYEY